MLRWTHLYCCLDGVQPGRQAAFPWPIRPKHLHGGHVQPRTHRQPGPHAPTLPFQGYIGPLPADILAGDKFTLRFDPVKNGVKGPGPIAATSRVCIEPAKASRNKPAGAAP